MSDLRHDPIDDMWVAMAGNRRARPMEFVTLAQRRPTMICPFCGGNEAETTALIAAFNKDGLVHQADPATTNQPVGAWSTRVISNKYPSFSTDQQSKPSPAIDPVQDGDLSMPYQTNQDHGLQ